MSTDDERREVARRLRELNFSMSYRSKRDMWDELRRVVGEYDDRPFGGVYTFARLADLIDPDTTTDTTKSPDLTTKCDRDALLALAYELDGLGLNGFSSGWSSDAVNVGSFARRIREALGVSE